MYKTGDKVIVRNDLLDNNSYRNVNFTNNMVKFRGKVVTIYKAIDNHKYYIREDIGYVWEESMFENYYPIPRPILEFMQKHNISLNKPFKIFEDTELLNILYIDNSGKFIEYKTKNEIDLTIFNDIISDVYDIIVTEIPVFGQIYYYVDEKGEIDLEVYNEDYIDLLLYDTGNFFETKEEAEEYINEMISKYGIIKNKIYDLEE